MTTNTTAPSLVPKPLPCRLNELYQELKQQEKTFHAAGNDEGECAVYAAAERLKEVVGEYIADNKAAIASFPAVLTAVLFEVDRARAKFPTWPTDPLHALAVLGEEFGELTQAVVQATYEPEKSDSTQVRAEAIHCDQHKQGS